MVKSLLDLDVIFKTLNYHLPSGHAHSVRSVRDLPGCGMGAAWREGSTQAAGMSTVNIGEEKEVLRTVREPLVGTLS